MAMSSNIKLDTQEQLMEDAKAKAKARYDRKLLDDQEEQIRNLLLMTGMQDPRNARVEMKPKKEYTHFEDELPASEDLMALMNNPEAVKVLAEQYRNKDNNRIVNDKKLDAIKDDFVPPMAKDPLSREERAEKSAKDMEGYVPGEAGYGRKLFAEQSMSQGYVPSYSMPAKGMVKNSEGVDRGGSKAPSSFGEFKDNTDGSIPEGLLDEPESLKKYKDLKENYPEGNWWMKQLTPKVDEALKALADKDPELLQLPEVQKLVKEREFWRNKGMDLFSFAPLATDPNATTQAAMGLIDKGDKNLMDAANNLETLRARQLEATKAVADNLTSQKQIAGGLHSAVLGLEGNLVQAAIPMIQEANNLSFQAEKIHEDGDVVMSKTLDNAKNFFSNIGGFAVRGKEKALQGLVGDISKLSNTNVRQAIEAARANIGNVNAPMRSQFIAALNNIDAGLADYDRAMNESAKLKAQAEQMVNVANGRMSAASNLGGEYKIPEWMNGTAAKETFQASQAPSVVQPNSEEPKVLPREEHPMEEAYGGVKPTTQKSSGKAPKTSAAPQSTTVALEPATPEPAAPKSNAKWNSPEAFKTWDSGTLAANLKALANAYNNKDVKGANVAIYESENFNGSNGGARANLAVAKVIANMNSTLANLQSLYRNNEGKFYQIINALDPSEADILYNYASGNKALGGLKTFLYNRATGRTLKKATTANPFASNTNSPLDDQYALIQQLLIDSGIV